MLLILALLKKTNDSIITRSVITKTAAEVKKIRKSVTGRTKNARIGFRGHKTSIFTEISKELGGEASSSSSLIHHGYMTINR